MKETLDTLSIGNLQLLQAKDGYRYSLDPVLLARFVNIENRVRIVDLGTGSGILPLIFASLGGAKEIVGIEIQNALAERAERNVQINGFQGRVRILQQDIRDIRDTIPEKCAELVVSNPPYRHPESGRIAQNGERAAARHELSGGLADFIAAASWLLKSGGDFAVIYLAERLPELMAKMISLKIEPKRLRMIHSRRGEAAKMVLLEGRKAGRPGLLVEKPLYIYQDGAAGRGYAEEVLQMYEEPPD